MASVHTRRSFIAATLSGVAAAQQPRDWTGVNPVQYPDPDIIALDRRFRRYIVANTVIRRLYTGTLWAEGPAWNGVGRYLVWSDIPNNVQMRWLEEDGRVTVFRNPFRLQQRQHVRFRRPRAFLRARWPPRGRAMNRTARSR